jgi:hypothetical protein
MGLAILPRYVAQDSLAAGALVSLLERWSLPAQEIHAVFPSPRLVPAKVSGFVAWLQGQFSPQWWLSGSSAASGAEEISPDNAAPKTAGGLRAG